MTLSITHYTMNINLSLSLSLSQLMISMVGTDDFGTKTISNFASNGVSTEYVFTTPNAPTGVAQITVTEDGQNAIVVVAGANDELTPENVYFNAFFIHFNKYFKENNNFFLHFFYLAYFFKDSFSSSAKWRFLVSVLST